MPVLAAIGAALMWVVRFLIASPLVWRILLQTGLAVILPAVLFTFFRKFGGAVIDWSMSYITANMSPVVIEVTGLAGWFATHLRIQEIFVLVMSAYIVRFIVRSVRGSKVG